MRRSILCCLSLVLGFTLSFLHQETVAHAGDALPPGCCKLFAEPEFDAVESDGLSLSFPEFLDWQFATSTVAPARSEAAPCQFVYVPKSNRFWDFGYEPSKTSTSKPASYVVLKHKGQITIRRAPATTAKIRSQKKHIAPVLFWRTGTAAEMTMVLRLIGREASSLIQVGIAPSAPFPIRIARLVVDCLLFR